MSRRRVAVYGATGYLGAELIRRLWFHPHFEVSHVFASDHIGQPLAEALPHLEGKCDLEVSDPSSPPPPDADVLALALPHSVSHALVARVMDGPARILDLSGAFRADTGEAHQAAYGEAHPLPELLPRFVYGLPELNRASLRGAPWVSSPGCFATALTLGLLPLARAGWLRGSVQSVAMTGSSGAGATPTATTHHPARAHNLRVYRPLVHNHAGEVAMALTRGGALEPRIDFVPVAAPLTRGILATSFARVPAEVDAVALEAAFAEAYGGEALVLRPRTRLPEVVAVQGSCYCEVGFVVGPPEGAVRWVNCVSALDNLVKGGAGQAVQNLNLMFELDETLGLLGPGLFP